MKHDDFLKQLNAELDSVELPMSEQLKNEPIKTAEKQTNNDHSTGAGTRLTRRIPRRAWYAAGACAAAACVAAVCVISALRPNNPGGTDGEPTYPTFTAEPTCMYLSINPSVVTLLNAEGVVEKAVALNADGDSLLLGGNFGASLCGLSATEAAKRIADRAAAMGYMDINADGTDGYNKVDIRFEGAKAVDGDLLNSVKDGVSEWFKEKGVLVYVQAASSAQDNFTSLYNGLLNAPASYLRNSTDGGAEAVLKDTVEGVMNEVVSGALAQFDLYKEIFEKNSEIKKSTGVYIGDLPVLEGKGYWELDDETRQIEGVSALEADMVCLLDEMYYTFGEDYRRSLTWIADTVNRLEFETAYSFSQSEAENAEYFRSFSEIAVSIENVDAEFVLNLTAFALVHGYSEELLSAASSLMDYVLDWAEEKVAECYEKAEAVLASHAQELYERGKALYNEKRAPVTDEQYAAFLEKISEKN